MSLDPDKIVRQVEATARRLDAAAEAAGMRLARLTRKLHGAQRSLFSPAEDRAYERLKRAEARLADVREAAGDAVYQLEQVRKGR